MKLGKNLKKYFPLLLEKIGGKTLVYLDAACSPAKSKAVIGAVLRYYADLSSCGGRRSSHLISQKIEEETDLTREKIKRFINASDKNEIIFTSGATEGLNLVAYCFPFSSSKNEVVVSDLEHNSNLLPFLEAQKRGKIKLRIFETEKNGDVDLNKFEKFVSKKTALVSITRASNVFGGVLPIWRISEIVHRAGAVLMADDAQFLSSHKEDVVENGIDLLVFSSHKIGGPVGAGILYGKNELLEKFGNFKVGGGTVKKLFFKNGKLSAEYLGHPYRFEAGVQNYAGILGTAAAIDFLEKLGTENIRSHIAGLVEYLVYVLSEISQIEILGNVGQLSDGAIVSFCFKNKNHSSADFNVYLNNELPRHIIAVRAGEQCANILYQSKNIKKSVRVSFFAYNDKEDIDYFIGALKKYLRS